MAEPWTIVQLFAGLALVCAPFVAIYWLFDWLTKFSIEVQQLALMLVVAGVIILWTR